MKKIIAFQIVLLALVALCWLQGPLGNLPVWLQVYELAYNSVLIAALGGVFYCLRALYYHRSVKKNWDESWELWYYLRPLASAISGLVAYLFLKAGLIILEGEHQIGAGNYGFLALAFIAGYNVNNFAKKIEDIANSSFGIEKSNSSKNTE